MELIKDINMKKECWILWWGLRPVGRIFIKERQEAFKIEKEPCDHRDRVFRNESTNNSMLRSTKDVGSKDQILP